MLTDHVILVRLERKFISDCRSGRHLDPSTDPAKGACFQRGPQVRLSRPMANGVHHGGGGGNDGAPIIPLLRHSRQQRPNSQRPRSSRTRSRSAANSGRTRSGGRAATESPARPPCPGAVCSSSATPSAASPAPTRCRWRRGSGSCRLLPPLLLRRCSSSRPTTMTGRPSSLAPAAALQYTVQA